MAYSRIYDIQIGLYEKDMDDFYEAVKIYEKKIGKGSQSPHAIGRLMLMEKVEEILNEVEKTK